jgi:hypothetical protein
MKQTKSSSRIKKQAEEITELNKIIAQRNKMIYDLQDKLNPKDGVAPDPFKVITKVMENHTPLTQNKVIEDVVIEMGVERIKEYQLAEANMNIASERLEDFQKRYPGIVKYKPTI